MSSRLTLLLLLLAGVLALWLNHGMGAPLISNDGYQYLDAAANARSGRGLSTDLAHFDEQVAYGRFPVPFTHFAPAYPCLIAVLCRVGMAPEFAAWLISALAFIATVWLIWDIGTSLGARAGVIALFSVLWIAHANALSLVSMVLAETLFTALLLAMVALVARDLRRAGTEPILLPAIGLAAAASYWVRYAGLFLIPVALLYIAWRAWQSRRTLPWAVAAGSVTALCAAAIPLRNIHYTGSWQGGFNGGAGHSLRLVAVETVKAGYHILFGIAVRADAWVLLVFVATVGYLAVRSWRTKPAAIPKHLPAAACWIGVVVAAYCGGVMLAALRSIAGDFPRYYLPVYPVILALAAALCLARDRRQYLAIGLLVASIMWVEGKSLVLPPTIAGASDKMRATLGQETAPGVSIGQWLRMKTGTGESIVSVNGQMLHYFVQRPVVSVIEPIYSNRPTGQATFQTLMREWHARFLVVMPNTSPKEVPEQEAIPFLRDLAAGIVPAWLRPAAHTPNLAVFECPACVGR